MSRRPRYAASTTLTTMAITTAMRKMVVIPWSNIACASEAGVPAWVMSWLNVDCATTSTPTAITAIAITETRIDTTVNPIARLRSRRITPTRRLGSRVRGR